MTNEKGVIAESVETVKAYFNARAPSNLNQIPDLVGAGQLAGFLALLPMVNLIPIPLIIGAALGASGKGPSSWFDESSKKLIKKVQYAPSGRTAGMQIQLGTSVLERVDGKVDIGFKLKVTATPAYKQNENDDTMVRSLFQDRVEVMICPTDTSLTDINNTAVVPVTNINTVSYTNQIAWSAKLGFSMDPTKVGAGGDVSFTRSFTAASSFPDFAVEKQSDGNADKIMWSTDMKNLYEIPGTQPSTRGYQLSDPYSIVVNGFFAKWLLIPPAAARKDLDMEYFAGYSSVDNTLRKKTIKFDIIVVQRLMHAEVVGRGGASGAKVGGAALVLPSFILAKILLTIDLEAGTITHTNRGSHAQELTVHEMV
jgi:hypothetical protein